MATKDVILSLRTKNGLSQDELAEKVFITRQAVSRWENGETVPNPDTLKLLSALFDVSINTLLGAPRKLICQCCGMPLEDSLLSREPDGSFNEDYCKWCYADGQFAYQDLQTLTDFLVEHMSNENWSAEQARAYFEAQLPQLQHWREKKEEYRKPSPRRQNAKARLFLWMIRLGPAYALRLREGAAQRALGMHQHRGLAGGQHLHVACAIAIGSTQRADIAALLLQPLRDTAHLFAALAVRRLRLPLRVCGRAQQRVHPQIPRHMAHIARTAGAAQDHRVPLALMLSNRLQSLGANFFAYQAGKILKKGLALRRVHTR